MLIRHVILDRDGVLNQEAGDGGFVRKPEEWHWIDGAREALAELSRQGIRLSVVSNQSGVGRGLMSERDLESVHARMLREAQAAGARIEALYVCPHAPEAGCHCRKPKPGLVQSAIAAAGVPKEATILVGDDGRDLAAARSAGIRAALVLTGKGAANAAQSAVDGVPVYGSLLEFARAAASGTVPATMADPIISRNFKDHAAVLASAAESLPAVLEQAVGLAYACLAHGHKILACGNGGSAADAQHLVAELVGRFRDERRALPALTLTGDPATLTALANDYGYARVFARQVEALARPGDLLIAISTSGNSANVVEAAQAGRAAGCTVIGMSGDAGGQLTAHCELMIRAPSSVVARIQEIHGLCIHALVDSLDERLRRPTS